MVENFYMTSLYLNTYLWSQLVLISYECIGIKKSPHTPSYLSGLFDTRDFGISNSVVKKLLDNSQFYK